MYLAICQLSVDMSCIHVDNPSFHDIKHQKQERMASNSLFGHCMPLPGMFHALQTIELIHCAYIFLFLQAFSFPLFFIDLSSLLHIQMQFQIWSDVMISAERIYSFMKKKIISFLTILAMLFVWSPVRAEPLPSDSDVIILYENDVHFDKIVQVKDS